MLRSAVVISRVIVLAAILRRLLRHYLTSSESQKHKPQSKEEKQNKGDSEPQPRASFSIRQGFSCNSNALDALELRKPIMGNVIETLVDPNTHLIGIYGSQDEIKGTLLQGVCRRVQRDQLFGMVVTAMVTKYPNVNKIQEDIAFPKKK